MNTYENVLKEAIRLNKLAQESANNTMYQEAEERWKKCEEIYTKLFFNEEKKFKDSDIERRDILIMSETFFNLGNLYYLKDRFEDAVDYLKKVIILLKRIKCTDLQDENNKKEFTDLQYANALYLLSKIYTRQIRYEEAESNLDEVLNIYKERFIFNEITSDTIQMLIELRRLSGKPVVDLINLRQLNFLATS